ncbi:MAG: protein kinase [Myxococcales bacterium]|nr:protein kinase [Myxococcales bacterium]
MAGPSKILDFGVAKAVNHHVTTDRGVLKGKTPYLTPEQLQGHSVEARADISQLGIVIHEMLTGRRFFEGDSCETFFRAIAEM